MRSRTNVDSKKNLNHVIKIQNLACLNNVSFYILGISQIVNIVTNRLPYICLAFASDNDDGKSNAYSM